MIRSLLFLMIFWSFSVTAQKPGKNRILLIPLDDRPPCLQFTQRMGQIAGAEVVAPPLAMLGQFTTPGQSEAIGQWILSQDLSSFDAAIVCLDMLAYGGLVGSRVHQVPLETAVKRLEIIAKLREKAPRLPLYAQSVLMRLAPSADMKNDAYRAQLARWAEISPDPSRQEETAQLAKVIPATALADYQQARLRNHTINQKAIEWVKKGIIDYLLITQDDAKPQGVHIAEGQRLREQIHQQNLQAKVALQPGTDEVSMLLLARFLTQKAAFTPKIKVYYSSDSLSKRAMPFEDRPLTTSVRYQIESAGATQVDKETDAQILLYVYTSRQQPQRAISFVNEIKEKLASKKHVIVADIDPVGNVQGGDSVFSALLIKHQLLPALSGYASWNTAGNTLGTALPQGVTYYLASQRFKQPKTALYSAQQWFLLNRVLDDYYFHTLIRPEANRRFGKPGLGALILDESRNKQVEAFCLERLQGYLKTLEQDYFTSKPFASFCQRPQHLQFSLPWHRTFEALIDFDLDCSRKN
ncbi:DUF4127 family protein [Siphonobacter sp. SORGH_AS_0500]|uniref:DUF4127 family protein n=1 Tax=Siphonobacter sp. SORGH_AS_0500 TaxID=1864824 RepID=UPI0028559CA3|nr:DUF4127 family protein [Siphonobacter sp. SORGH_AS_0500]MDR6197335.1 hypothetical protein [Siphonobacter sp. SORGH_AS_0500]